MKAIMYHYVRKFDKIHPNFKFLDIDSFRKQLDYFERKFGFVNYQEWIDYIENGRVPKVNGKVLLTFDDAMKCHFDYVYPELIKRGLWGIFYVPTQPYSSGKILEVHRIHLLCGAFNGEELFQFLKSLVFEEMIPDEKRKEFVNMTYTSQINFSGVSEFKRLLNYFVDYQYQEDLISSVASHFGYEFNVSNFYVAKENLKIMSHNGMIIGSHSDSHPVMSKLTENEQKHQIVESFRFLDGIGVIKNKSYCHPYGGFKSYDKNTINLLNQNEVEYSFSVEPREITYNDIRISKQSLPRFDCNKFPYGSVA